MPGYQQRRSLHWLTWAMAVTCCVGIANGQNLQQLEERATQQAVKRVANSVVQIETIGGLDVVEGTQINNGPTTGLIVDQEGYVVSSSFNFIQLPASIFVRTSEGERIGAEIVAQDFSRKLVLLKLDTDKTLAVPDIISRSGLQVGQTMVAVGKIYDWKTPNVSVGILSATHRIWDKAIQTDAKISPANFGGPLIDLRGRVAGILVPMSQSGNQAVSGAEWYDSGIGFAVPMNEFMERIETLKRGQDLKEGRLGVALKGSDIYADKAIVSSSRGPAAKAGIRSGDEIVMINQRPVTRQAHFKHAIGPLYANDRVSVTVKRGDENQTFQLSLATEIEPFVAPALGVVLGHTQQPVVQFITPNSPADLGGVKLGDTIVAVNGDTVDLLTGDSKSEQVIDQNSLRQLIAALDPGKETKIEILRKTNGEYKKLELPITPEKMSADPIRFESEFQNTITVTSINVSEFKNKCLAFLPQPRDNSLTNSAPPCAVLIWVAKPGPVNKKNLETIWKESCAKHNCALLVVQSADEKRWQPDESEFIVKAIELLKKQIVVDENRIVIGGAGSGGSMAAMTVFARRDMFRGLVLVEAQFPNRVNRPETLPTQPLLVFGVVAGDSKRADQQRESLKKLRSRMFPLFEHPTGGRIKDLAPQIIQWTRSVNRF